MARTTRGADAAGASRVIDVLIPVLNRPERAERVIASLEAATSVTYRALFLVSPGDRLELRACRAVGAARAEVALCPFERTDGDYARKTNHGFSLTEAPWIFQGADDLRFEDTWDLRALAAAERDPDARVIGTNDLGNPAVQRGRLSTHSLVSREYVDTVGGSLDGPGVVLHEGYRHNFVDEELIGLARARRVFAFARDAIVEHLHPRWDKGAMDTTYELGLEGFHDDSLLFRQRQRRMLGSRRGRS